MKDHQEASSKETSEPKSRVFGFVAGLVMITFVCAGLYWLMFVRSGSNLTGRVSTGGDVEIVLTEDGFVPDTISIRRGTTVVFTSTTGEYFWPASNLHPSHSIYSEFDPKEPIAPDGSWSFRFDKPGEWRFHDHIAPYYTGTITVTEE